MRNVFTDTPYKNFNLSVTGAFSASVTEAIRTKPNAYTIADTLRWTKGRHEMSMGFEYRKQSLDKNFRWLLDPAMTFDASIHRVRRGRLLHRASVAAWTRWRMAKWECRTFPCSSRSFRTTSRSRPSSP